MNVFTASCIAAGLVFGLVIAVIILKLVNPNHRAKTEYDERQKVIRGRGYMYGFYTIVIFECIQVIFSAGKIPMPVSDFVLHFCSIMLGCLVLCVYCIWNGAYWGINNNPKRYMAVFAAVCLLNAIPVIGAATHGGLIRDGESVTPIVNLMVLIMFGVIAVELLIKQMVDRRAETGEE